MIGIVSSWTEFGVTTMILNKRFLRFLPPYIRTLANSISVHGERNSAATRVFELTCLNVCLPSPSWDFHIDQYPFVPSPSSFIPAFLVIPPLPLSPGRERNGGRTQEPSKMEARGRKDLKNAGGKKMEG